MSEKPDFLIWTLVLSVHPRAKELLLTRSSKSLCGRCKQATRNGSVGDSIRRPRGSNPDFVATDSPFIRHSSQEAFQEDQSPSSDVVQCARIIAPCVALDGAQVSADSVSLHFSIDVGVVHGSEGLVFHFATSRSYVPGHDYRL